MRNYGTVNHRMNIIEFIKHVIPYSQDRRTFIINQSLTKIQIIYCENSKNVYLALAILFLIPFIDSLFDTERSHKPFFWEVSTGVYRLFTLGIAFLFMKSCLDIRSAEKLKEE